MLNIPRIASGECMSGLYFALNFKSLSVARREVSAMCRREGVKTSKAQHCDSHTFLRFGLSRLLDAGASSVVIARHEML